MKHILFLMMLFAGKQLYAQNPENWTQKDLIEPAELASVIQSGKKVPLIICVGPGAVIPNSIHVGMAKEEANLDKFKEEIKKYHRKKEIVIYCGCCPFEHCPNVRPAIQALKDMHYTNYRLLDLPHNVKTDWISKGYPVTN